MLLRGKPRPRYAPLTGAEARIDETAAGDRGKPLSWNMSPFQGQSPALERPGNSFNSLLRRLRPTNELRRSPQPRCKNSINSNPRRERPERASSPQPRATPWVSMYKRLRPVRAKVWANGWLLLLPLQGVGNGDMAPRALPWATDLLVFQPATDLLGFQPAPGPSPAFFRAISIT